MLHIKAILRSHAKLMYDLTIRKFCCYLSNHVKDNKAMAKSRHY